MKIQAEGRWDRSVINEQQDPDVPWWNGSTRRNKERHNGEGTDRGKRINILCPITFALGGEMDTEGRNIITFADGEEEKK